MADLKPPFTAETAQKKLKAAQDAWNTQNPSKIATAYTPDSIWRNRDTFLTGTAAIVDFLTAKWQREKSYRLRKELFAYADDRIAVQFWYEYQDAHDGMRWKRCYGLEDWTFDRDTGKMRKRQMSGNDVLIGPDGNGEGRWFVDGVDVNEVKIGEEHW
ncbi:hypothetical protein DTO027B5_6228 [Paecilomyces variotii]|nr:hypothetical protein DTO027B3_6684 [Paecilomyces variotii]KAJ9331949.1 hypothetical protein DTO027B5_6228 [Paecilomyces variotii]